MEKDYSYIDANLSRVMAEIARAADVSGRSVDDVTFLAAIKSADVDEINHLHKALGVSHVGENRVQQLMGRYDALDRNGLSMHFIGKLQRNKVKYIIDKVDMIHSVDTVSLADEISTRAIKSGRRVDVLVEINIGEEADKSGAMPSEAEALARHVDDLEGVRLCGFMTMAPVCPSKEEYKVYFKKMRELSFRIWNESLGKAGAPVLSMGMSDSFAAAIEEGATIVRVGRCLFNKN